MTGTELHAILTKAIEEGHGHLPVYFDTEARTFHYHMAKIGSVCVVPDLDELSHIGLHED